MGFADVSLEVVSICQFAVYKTGEGGWVYGQVRWAGGKRVVG